MAKRASKYDFLGRLPALKTAGLNLMLALVGLLIGLHAEADDHPLVGEQIAEIVAAQGQSPDKSPLRFYRDNPYFQSSILTADAKFFPGSSGVIVLFTGLGGNVESYGSAAESSVTFCNKALKMGLFPVVVENPVYFGARAGGLSSIERSRIAEKFSNLSAQVNWFLDVLEKVQDRLIKSKSSPNRTKKLLINGRSAGAGLTFEVMDQAYFGNPRARRIFSSVDHIVLGGINSHVEPFFSEWTSNEDREDRLKPEGHDPLAGKVDRALNRQMSWGNREIKKTVGVAPEKSSLPPLTIMAGSQDQYLSFEGQIQIVSQFSASHPELSVTVVPTNGRHDPMAPFRSGEAKVRNGEVFGEVLSLVLNSGSSVKSPAKVGLHEVYLKSPLSPTPHKLCRFIAN